MHLNGIHPTAALRFIAIISGAQEGISGKPGLAIANIFVYYDAIVEIGREL